MKRLILLPLIVSVSSISHSELVGLDEASLERVSGQTGIGINIDKLVSVGSVVYSDEDATTGGELHFQNINIGTPGDVMNTAAKSQHLVDVDGTDGLFIDSKFESTRIQIGGISVGSHVGNRSFGQFVFDFEGDHLLNIDNGPVSGFRITSETSFTNVVSMWTTNGQTLRIDGMTIDAALTDAIFEEKLINATDTALVIDIPSYSSDITVSGVCFSVSSCSSVNSFGSFASSTNLVNSQIQIQGGGRENAGINFNAHFEFDTAVNATGDGNYFSYTDDATIKFAKQSGAVDITNLTFDIGRAETNIGDHIALQVDQVVGNFAVGDFSIAGNSVGAFEIQYDFTDGVHDAATYQNKSLIAPGVAFAAYDFSADSNLSAAGFDTDMTNFYSKVTSTSDGISLYNEWNLTAQFIYTDDGHVLIADNLQTWGSGYITLDIRNGADSIDNTNDVAEDFLAIGVRDYKVNYSLDGFKTEDGNGQLQSGYELLGLYSDAEFTLNAGIEIRGGGASGSGITFDGDVFMTEGNFGVTKTILNYDDGDALNDRNIGIYLAGVTYEFHFRDVTLDVDSGGIQIVLGDIWSEMDITDVRFGDKNTGSSMGGINVKQYQSGSQLTINGGGATSGCIGGTGVDFTACEADGGYWLDTGSQGVTIASKRILNQRSGNLENSVTWTTNRPVNDNGTPGVTDDDFYDPGLSLKIDNIYTSDGYDDTTNTHGIQNTMTLDVAKSRVIKKDTGADNNGIIGNEGDELITDGAGGYTYVTSPTDLEKANRPETLVLSNNVKIKELNIDSILLQHPNAGSADTLINGIKLQNLNLNSTLSVSPIR